MIISAWGKGWERLDTKGLEHFDREDLWRGGPQSCWGLCWIVSGSAVTHRREVPLGNLSAPLPCSLCSVSCSHLAMLRCPPGSELGMAEQHGARTQLSVCKWDRQRVPEHTWALGIHPGPPGLSPTSHVLLDPSPCGLMCSPSAGFTDGRHTVGTGAAKFNQHYHCIFCCLVLCFLHNKTGSAQESWWESPLHLEHSKLVWPLRPLFFLENS